MKDVIIYSAVDDNGDVRFALHPFAECDFKLDVPLAFRIVADRKDMGTIISCYGADHPERIESNAMGWPTEAVERFASLRDGERFVNLERDDSVKVGGEMPEHRSMVKWLLEGER